MDIDGPSTTSRHAAPSWLPARIGRTRADGNVIMSTLDGHWMSIHTYSSINWSEFQLDVLTGLTAPRTIPVTSLDPMGGEASDLFLKASS